MGLQLTIYLQSAPMDAMGMTIDDARAQSEQTTAEDSNMIQIQSEDLKCRNQRSKF